MQFQRESASPALFAEMEPLLRSHYEEISHDKSIPLDPDWTAYLAAEAAGKLLIFTARTTARDLVGYAVFFVGPHPHYKSTTFAVQDILFVRPDHRGTGGRLVIWADQALTDYGVDRVVHHVKVAHDFSPMLERLGYELMDKIMVKNLRVASPARVPDSVGVGL